MKSREKYYQCECGFYNDESTEIGEIFAKGLASKENHPTAYMLKENMNYML